MRTASDLATCAEYGDLCGIITDAESGIVRQVQEQIAQLGPVIRELSDKVAELDWSVQCRCCELKGCSRLALL